MDYYFESRSLTDTAHTPQNDVDSMASWDTSRFQTNFSLYESLLASIPNGLLEMNSPRTGEHHSTQSNSAMTASNECINSANSNCHVMSTNAQSESKWDTAIEQTHRRGVSFEICLPQRRRTSKDNKFEELAQVSGHKVSKAQQKTRQYRFRMRDVSAASLWAAWQGTSAISADATTLDVFKASRRGSS